MSEMSEQIDFSQRHIRSVALKEYWKRCKIQYFSTCLLLLLALNLNGQSYSISGRVVNARDSIAIPVATVMVLNSQDSILLKGAVTDFDGRFEIDNIESGNYDLKVQYIGYQPAHQSVTIENQHIDLGKIEMQEMTNWLDQVTIEAKRATSTQKGDTTQFNAGSFKTMKDASAQSLIEKLPGINLQDGKIQAQGEEIVQIFVDGKPFFGQNVAAALQNLPAEIIQSVQIFDRLSDKAEMSGFDDGEREKTINIITKPNRRSGKFGRMSAGLGSDNRYLLGNSTNFFKEQQRVTVTVLSNNVNSSGYSADTNSDGESRPQNGIFKTQGVGINYNDNWGEKIEVSSSYQFQQINNDGNSFRIRNYTLPSSADQVYQEVNGNTRLNEDHQFNLRLDYDIDKSNRLLFRPYASIGSDKEESSFTGQTTIVEEILNKTENNRDSKNRDIELGGRLYYSHRFPKKGRSISLRSRAEYQSNDDESNRIAINNFYGLENRSETLNQFTSRDRKEVSWESSFSYTEPIFKKGQIEIEYEVGNNNSDSERLTYDVLESLNPQEVTYSLDTMLSNTFVSDLLSQQMELGYQFKSKKLRILIEGEYRRNTLRNEQQYPQAFSGFRTFENIAPTVRIDLQFSKNKRLDLDYDTYNRTPRIYQLQDVINISNPLLLRTGNPDLNQAFTNRFTARYRSRNPESEQSFYLYASSSITSNFITNSSTIAEESIELDQGVILEKGSQFSKPVNVNGYWSVRSYLNFGMPIDIIKSNGNISGSANYSHRPGLINEQLNFVKNTNLWLGLSISSNISENIDFRISNRSGFNLAENTLNPSVNNKYFYQSTKLTYDWVIWDDLVYRMDINHRYNNGLAEDIDKSALLMNMSIGTKILKNRRGELSLKVYDLFQQNNNVRRNVTELYIEDYQSNVLQRYFMLTLNYNLRHFNKGTTEADYKKLHGNES